MNGIRYHRRKNNLLVGTLAKKTGISAITIMQIENCNSESGYARITPAPFITLSDYFGIPISQLIREDFPEIPEPVRKGNISASSECENNPLTIFRRNNHLSYRKLSALFGVSHEEVRKICMLPEIPQKYANAVNELISRNGE